MTRAVTIAELGDQNVFTVDGTNNRVGIGSTLPTTKLDVNGTVTATAFVGSAVTINSSGIDVGSGIITAATLKVGSAITASGGIVTATKFVGDGSELTGVISGVELQFGGNSVGTAVTNIDFVGFSSVTAPVSGLATVTTSKQLTIGVRSGAAVTFTITGNTFNVINRAGGNVAIDV